MSNVLSTLSAIGALAMAATPLVAIGGIAHAAESGAAPAYVMVSDLDLGRPADAATFRQRLSVAADSVCAARGETGLNARSTCRQAVREEAMEQLGDGQRQDLGSAR